MIIKLVDGNELNIGSDKTTPYEVAKKLSISLAKEAVGAIYNDMVVEMEYPITSDGSLVLLKKEDLKSLEILNHSCAHLLANAIVNLYPNAKPTIGPAIEEGFYYDFDFGDTVISITDLNKIEQEMKKIVKSNLPIVREELSNSDALKRFKDNEYKIELIKEHSTKGDVITIYKQGDFYDLCRGGHVRHLGLLGNFKLTAVSGAYWRGDSKNKQLTRIYGTCFWDKKSLDNHLLILEERKKRDHKKLGKELDVFMFSEYGLGFPFWLNNGMILLKELEDFWFSLHNEENYKYIKTPTMLNQELWKISGHWKNYRENMYLSKIDKKTFAIKPMNCPGGMLVYKNSIHSYKDLPLRVGELGHVHRHEASGALNGLFRVRSFTQDDAHIFMRDDQLESEIIRLIKLFDKMYKTFDLKYEVNLSTRPKEKYIGDIKIWDKSEEILEKALIKLKKEYKINDGDGAFYGPKLDFIVKDSMNRKWQCGTIQLDMNLPERFDLTYISNDGTRKRPIMLHRAIYGSLERFVGILIEHYGAAFPLWLSFNQVKVIPVSLSKEHLKYANKVNKKLVSKGFRSHLDERDEKLGYKIREAQVKKYNYQIILGDKELLSKTISYRKYGEKETTNSTLNDFIKKINKERKNKS